ncbi:hypothetical protein C7S13_5718 [Burkholderia cepacia]|nr:hypothetical protein [Burkholderia cepacia]
MMTNDHEPDAGRHSLPVIRSDSENLMVFSRGSGRIFVL